MGDVRINLRIPEELFAKIKLKEENMSEGIRDTLTREYITRADEKESKEIDTCLDDIRVEKTRDVLTRADFTFPVGDVICADTNPQTQLWWCPSERMVQMQERAERWVKSGGFSFHVGRKGGGTWYSPDMIEEPEQERRRNGRFSPSCHMMNALVGDRLVWLEIESVEKAVAFLNSHTDIPCALRCDVHRYTSDLGYKDAFDRANEIFIYYYINGRNKKVLDDVMSESDVAEMYDL